MPTYVIRIYHLGVLIDKAIITAGDSLSAINYHIAASDYPMFTMRNKQGQEEQYVEPAYEFKAIDQRLEMS